MSAVHILGICGTFMGGLAVIAKQAGFEVSGADENVYPPMSTQLLEQGIALSEGFREEAIPDHTEIVVGNVMSRGKPLIESLLNQHASLSSGPQWLYEHVLKDKWVLAVAGTHGKTTTASMLVWILEYAGLKPGFLIGGVPENFGISARLGETDFFVIEADEYDTAFFDKRSKFIHYHPRTLILNNLEFDHADIFDSLDDIKKQFHYLLKIVPGNGLIVHNINDENLDSVLKMGCWSETSGFESKGVVADNILSDKEGWFAIKQKSDGSLFEVYQNGALQGVINWQLLGDHNVSNALAALAAAQHVGVPIEHGISALCEFKGIKRRMQHRGSVGTVTVYDDFAHHPTAIKLTLQGLREKVGNEAVFAVFEPRSNTMKMGVHQQQLADAFKLASQVFLLQPENLAWDLAETFSGRGNVIIEQQTDTLVDAIVKASEERQVPVHILVMSNGGFDDIHDKILHLLEHSS